MTQTTQQGSKLSPEAQELILAAANVIYDKQGIDMIKQGLGNTKSKDAIVPQVALAATTVLHQMDDRLQQLSDEEVWGKMGVVHSVLGTIFEVAKHLGYNMPASSLKPAYEMTEHMLESQRGQPSQDEQPEEQQMSPEQQQPDMQQQPQQQQMPMMQGAMPQGGM